MVEPSKKVWMDGELVDWKDAHVPILTHTLHYGVGVFEGIRCYRLSSGSSAIFRLKSHIRRLFDGLKILSMKCPYTKDQITDACVETVRVNGLSECYIRPIIFLGQGAMGLYADNPTRAAIVVWKWGAYLGEGALERGVRAKISSFTRHHVNVAMVQGKIMGQYVSSILAKREVMADGYDEAIMLDTNGYVAECSGENIFAVRDGVIWTPPATSPILPGITRDTVIKLARGAELEVREEAFTRDFLYVCDEVFIVGTAAEVVPVREIDNRPVGSGKPGVISQRLQKAYFDVVRGSDERHRGWLTPV
jgi:branched-chain amino acid aminotransferase